MDDLLNEDRLRKIIGPTVFDGLVFDAGIWSKGSAGSRVNVNRPENFRKQGFTTFFSEDIGKQQERLSVAINALGEQGLPPVFIFTGELPWLICRALRSAVSQLLWGPLHLLNDVYMLPDFWAWHVKPGESGWKPHRDKGSHTIGTDGHARSCTVWIPLTSVTAAASHIAVLPRDLDPGYGSSEIELSFNKHAPDIVPLLCPQKGRILVWDQEVFHWGTRGSYLERKSMAFEFQRSVAPYYSNPVFSFTKTTGITEISNGAVVWRLPHTFDERLTMVARQVMQYRHMHFVSGALDRWCRDRLVKKGYRIP